jgi:DNA relaxase NicK
MGSCLQISGVGMTSLRALGWDDRELVTKLFKDGFRFSRIDVAIDTYFGYTTQDCVDFVNNIGLIGKAEKANYRCDMVTGAMTLYVGSERISDAFARIYDKSVKENEAEQRTRFEMQYNRDYAKWAASTLAQIDFGGVVWDMLDYVRFGAIPNFPNKNTVDTTIPPKRERIHIDSTKADWVRKCRKAIAHGIHEMGAVEFERLVREVLGYSPFDRIRE